MMNPYDEDQSGTIGFEEFAIMMSEKLAEKDGGQGGNKKGGLSRQTSFATLVSRKQQDYLETSFDRDVRAVVLDCLIYGRDMNICVFPLVGWNRHEGTPDVRPCNVVHVRT